MAKKKAVLSIKDAKPENPKFKSVRVEVGIQGLKERLWAEVEAPSKAEAIMSALSGIADSLTQQKRESDSDFDLIDAALVKAYEKAENSNSKKRRKKLGLVAV